MAAAKLWFVLCIIASWHSVTASQDCPSGWKNYSSSCYLFVIPNRRISQMSWEDSRANCKGYGADLVSILDTSEVDFIYKQTSILGNYKFWIGLFRNKTTNDPKEGWVWSDKNNFTNPQQWRPGEPNNYQNNEDCAEFFANSKKWNDNDCSKLFSSICKRKKGLPFPPTPTSGTLPPTKDPPPRCDHGWIAYNRSCYRMFRNWRPWAAAKSSCRDTGGHLVRIDNVDEQHFLSNLVRPTRWNFWIGLNDLASAGNWTWEFRPNDHSSYKNWQSGEPNGLGVEQCAEMYGYVLAGFWNDANCRGYKPYICEKEEGRNACPEGWIAYNDICYQFNLDASQKMTWPNAEAACNAIGNFASLAKINSQREQDFINKRIQTIANGGVWIGLNDIKNENVFRWSADDSQLGKSKSYQIWVNGRYPSENQENRDCVMMQSVRKDGAWTVQNCSQAQNFVCMRHRDLPFCNAPLGMENGKISDSQITASSSLPPTRPSDARFRHSGSWCPQKAAKTEYLQIVLPFLADIRTIVTQGNLTSYAVKVSKDGRKFRDYNPSSTVKFLIPRRGENYDFLDTTSLVAKVVRIYPHSWRQYPCLRVEFVGCPAQAPKTDGCEGNNWQKGPGKLCYQINSVPKTWIDARSTCQDRGGDLLAMATPAEMNEIAAKIRFYTYYWIGLNDRDYRNSYYWSNTDANGMINWGSGAPDNTGYTNVKGCVRMKRGGTRWTDADCSTRYPFICMKGEHYTPTNFVGFGPTGVWMSSAKYYWPLSGITDNKMVLGTILGNVTGKVTVTTGVREKPNSAIKFSGEGSYIDVGKFENECFGNPDLCSGLSLSFMAWFDTTTISSSKEVYIMGSMKDKTKSNGLSVYVQNNEMTFVVSGTRKYWNRRISVTDNEWLHYVMTFNDSSGVDVWVNGGRVTGSRGDGGSGNTNPTSSFKIGHLSGSNLKSGEVRLAMVAFWNRKISDYDIPSIYKAEFGTCPFSWFEYGMSCYQINKDRISQYSASYKCQSFGGDLINIDTNVEQAFISLKLTDRAWIGAQDKRREGVFVRTDLKPIQYSNWNGGEPNDHWRGEDCTETHQSGLWNDLPCYYSIPYICEKEKEVKVKPTNITTTATPTVSSIKKSMIICHYTRKIIGCPSGLVIKINSAFWGRREKTTCTYVSVKPCGVKGIPTITKNLKKKCDHYGSCNLHASESESYLDNPCPTVHKYLEVDYTCTKDTLPKTCKSEWTTFNGNARLCYRLFHTPKTWNEARTVCKNAGGELLSIPGDQVQRFATSLMERAWYSNVWIGLNDLNTKGVYEWSDGSSVTWTNWYVGQPDERKTEKSCVFMSLRRGKKGWMYWSDQNCTRKYAFICRKDIESTTQKPTTVTPAKKGKCNVAGWVTNDKLSYCYLYETSTSGKNWLNAQNTCRARSGKLVSIDNKEENEFVRKLSNNSIWLGLETRGVFRGHQWSDGQPVRFTNWDYGQPNSYNGLDACVAINPDTGFWNDRDCNEVKDVVCKMAKNFIQVTTAPVIYPTPGSSLCKKDWTLYKGMCYVVGNQTSSDYLTWQDAEKKCQSFGNGGHLVSIHSDDEQKFIKFLMTSKYTSYFWTGLNDMGTEASYQWTDGSYYNYANWNAGEPNDYNRQENCIHLVRYNGKWNDHHCQLKFSFICKAYNESYTPPVRPTEVPRPANDGYCPKGWIAHAQYCYEFHTDPSEYRSWDDARDSCERGRNSSANGELASIHDEFEEAFITTRIKSATKTLWIGMNNKHGYNNYFWVDNSIANYFKWNTREPSWGYGRCVEIVPYRWAAGRWNSVYCSKLNGYICKKAASKTPVTPTPTPTPQESNCKSGYKSYDKSCFKFNNDHKKSFDNARKICQKDGGDLMVVDSQFKQAYLIYILERYIGSVWIGYFHEPYSTFKFVDHSSAVHTYWGSGQPSRQLSQRSCTQVNATGSNFGVWDDVDCGTTNPFICEIYQGEPRITIPLNGTCADGWKYYNKHCYKHFTSWQNWAQAQFICSTNGANLVSIHDDREQDFLINFYQLQNPSQIWTGLNDRARERGYSWVDNSPVNYVNWRDGEPNDHTGYENCIEMQTRSGQWNDLPCTIWRQFMCKKNIECSSAIPLDLSLVTVTDTYNSTTMGADKAIITDLKDHNSAWCTKNTSGTAKIMIDLNQLVRITGITVMGRGLNYVKSFRIDYERDENWRTFYPNRDYQSAIHQHTALASTKTFRYPITADGLSITPLTWTGDMICMSIRLHGCAFVCQKQLFLSFPTRIRDDVITASSSKYPTHGPKQTAIEGHSWCAGKNDKNQRIQFNFGKEILLSVVRTFGDKKESYVKKYSMQFSEDGMTWTDYVQHGVTRIFNGNNDPNSPMRHTLANPIEASYVRIIPISWNKNICMRISLLGCDADCTKPLLASGKAPSVRYSSTDKDSNPEYTLFNSGKAWCTGKSPVTEQYLEIRFRAQYRLSKIATLPSPVGYEKGGEITSFTIKYNKGKNWFVHGPKGQAKTLIAINENDRSKPMVNELTDYYRNRAGLRTRAIRIYPKTFSGSPSCLRVELYGCLSGIEVVPTTPTSEQKVVNVSVRFTGIEWNNKLSDQKSEEFAETSKKITNAVESVYSNSESFRSAKVTKLTKGSVIAIIKLVFNPEFVDRDNETTLANAVATGKVGKLEVDKDSFKVVGAGTAARKGDSGLSGGAVAGVVITVLIILAVAAVLAFFLYRRKKRNSLFAPKHFDNPISYSSKAYDMDD